MVKDRDLHIRMPKADYDYLKQLADREDRTPGNLARVLVIEGLRQRLIQQDKK